VSTFRFMDGWFIEPGTVTIEEFSEQWLASEPRPGDYWDHLLSWWEQRDRDDVLLLSYEGMILDAEGTIRRVAQFCGIELDAGLLALTLERSSLGYMRSHDGQFDDLLMREAAERHGLLPGGGESSKVRTGGVGGHRHELPARVGEAIDARWVERVPPEHGLPDYASLVAALG